MKKTALKTPLYSFAYFFIIVIIAPVIFDSCDTFEEDHVADASLVEEHMKIAILPNTSAVIDFSTLVKVRKKVSAKITGEPSLGSIERLGKNLYKYSPFDDVSAGEEAIPFALYDEGNNYLLSDTLSIVISSSLADSCSHTAVQDHYFVNANTTTRLNVLQNDLVCDSLAVDISILQSPAHGIVQVHQNYINYTVDDYSGPDQFVYSITDRGDSATRSDAVVLINMNDSTVSDSTCQLLAMVDYFNYTANSSTQYFDVLQNDSTCTDQIALSVIVEPVNGIASFLNNNLLQYTPDITDADYTDSLVYRVCEGSNCKESTVSLNATYEICEFVEAFDDVLDISDSTFVGSVFIDVTRNDSYCAEFSLKILEAPSYGSAQVESGGVLYDPDESAVSNDEIKYELCTTDRIACDTATVSIIR